MRLDLSLNSLDVQFLLEIPSYFTVVLPTLLLLTDERFLNGIIPSSYYISVILQM